MGLTEKEQSGRNYLKEKKPLVFEKVSKFTEKFQRGESIAIIQLQYNYICNMKCEHCSIKRFQGANQNRRLSMLSCIRSMPMDFRYSAFSAKSHPFVSQLM